MCNWGRKTVTVEFVAKTKHLNPLLLEVTETLFLGSGGELKLLMSGPVQAAVRGSASGSS